MTATAAPAAFRRDGDTLVAELSGDWTLEHSAPRFETLVAPALATGATAPKVRVVTFDAGDLGTWDSSLLIFLRQAQDYCDEHKIELDTAGLPPEIGRLLALARVVPERVTEELQPRPKLSWVGRFGLYGVADWRAIHGALTFLGEVTLRMVQLARGRVRMRWRHFWVVVQQNSSGALPIVTLIALLIGIIIAFLGVVVLKRFGAGYYVSYLVGFGMLREMAALMTGIILAGRTGAGFAAELGTMKVTEEIDAYTTLGISPIDELVLPRVLGIFFMMPFLVLYADVVGITGGMGIAMAMLDLTPTQYVNGMLYAVEFSDTLLGVFKGVVFGAIVGMAGCMKGLQAGTDAGAVGRSATSAVVIAITLIITANAVIDWLAALLHV